MEERQDFFVTSFSTKEEFQVICSLMDRFNGRFSIEKSKKGERLKKYKVYAYDPETVNLFWAVWEQMQMARGFYAAEGKRPKVRNYLVEEPVKK